MKIVSFEMNSLMFDNGNSIVACNDANCFKHSYADFTQLEKTSLNHNFDEKTFKMIPCDSGFRFGDRSRTFFVHCYSGFTFLRRSNSNQNEYYGYNRVDVEYRDKDGNTLLKIEIMCM